MSSQRRILASRANGALSRGPSTPQGKEASSANAIRHGLLARCVVIKGESREAFQATLARYIERFQPADEVEMALVEEMAAAFWRLRRSWAIETSLLDHAIDAEPSGDGIDRMAKAFSSLAGAPPLGIMHRYETRLHMMYQRALHNLLLLRQAGIPNEPNPDSEHFDSSAALQPATRTPVPVAVEPPADQSDDSPGPAGRCGEVPPSPDYLATRYPVRDL